MKTRTIAPLFYLSTLVSSIGSFTFNMSLIAFMLQSGFHLGHASLIIGLQRLVPILVTGIWGHLTDRLSPRKTVAVAEILAAFMSVSLLLLWNGGKTFYPGLVALCVLRSVVVSFQAGSRIKITKILAGDGYKNSSKHAIWFNKATQGATLFGGAFAWFFIKFLSMKAAIAFDALTFVFAGAAAWLISTDAAENTTPAKEDWHQKFKDLFKFNGRAAAFDIILAVAMMGSVAFQSRMAGHDQSWAAAYMAGFGLAVWVAGFLENGVTSSFSSTPFWLLLGVSFCGLSLLTKPGVLSLSVFFIKDLSYWILLHRIASHIQTDTPVQRMGSVSSARMSIMIAILATGEILVGAWSSVVPLWAETILRGSVGLGVGLYLLAARARYMVAVANDRPAL